MIKAHIITIDQSHGTWIHVQALPRIGEHVNIEGVTYRVQDIIHTVTELGPYMAENTTKIDIVLELP